MGRGASLGPAQMFPSGLDVTSTLLRFLWNLTVSKGPTVITSLHPLRVPPYSKVERRPQKGEGPSPPITTGCTWQLGPRSGTNALLGAHPTSPCRLPVYLWCWDVIKHWKDILAAWAVG